MLLGCANDRLTVPFSIPVGKVLNMTSNTKTPDNAISHFQASRTVRWTDTDSSGFIHIGALIRMMEETEYAFLRSRDLSVVLTDGRGLMGFPRLSASVEIVTPVPFDTNLSVKLFLVELDGKSIVYEFLILNESDTTVASGRFHVAACRFPNDAPPYAVLTPEYVIAALTKPVTSTTNF